MKMQPFKAFITLIEFDQKIRSLIQDMQKEQDELSVLHADQDQVRSDLDSAGVRAHDLRKLVDEQELEMRVLDEQEKQKRQQLEGIIDPRAFESVKKEIDHLKAEQHRAELVLLDAWNKLETAQKELAVKQEQLHTKMHAIEEQIVQKQNELEQKKAEFAALEKERPVVGIPQEWLDRYEMMRLSVEDPVVAIEGESCGACSGVIINQDMIRLKRKAVLPCKYCFRLLYSKEAMQQDLESDE